jgi:hypothetical protein
MRILATVLPLLLLATTALAPQAAAATGCALRNPGHAVPTPFLVPPAYPNALGPATCTVAPVLASPGPAPAMTGLTFTSGTPPCPALPFIGALPGEFCGKLVPGLTGVDCTATVPGGAQNLDLANLRALVIGLDYVVPLTADGNVVEVAITDIEPLRYDQSLQGPVLTLSVHIDNPLPVDARVIAYPLASNFGPGILVGCV